jgi:hypothetical protein
MAGVLGQITRWGDQFARWLWNTIKPPRRKKWCVALYFVGVEEAGLNYPDTFLDPKMREAIENVKVSSIPFSDLHVAYRFIGKDGPVAEALSWLPWNFASMGKKEYEFKGCEQALNAQFNTGNDMRCFFKWVYRWCPADHYAIILCGHSFGPAGLFEKYGTIQVPESGLVFLREALEAFAEARHKGNTQASPLNTASAVPQFDPGESPIEALMDYAGSKVELVMFQNCWMATLETAYELRGVASFAVASQSLVPIGSKFLDFVWPYQDLFAALFTPNFGTSVMCALKEFYKDHWGQVAGLSCVPFALLDLKKMGAVTKPVKDLLKAIDNAYNPTTGLSARADLFDLARIGPRAPSEQAGDEALVDILKLCEKLKTDPSVASAAASLDSAITPVVADTFEVGPNGTASLFGGVSAFYRPPKGKSIIARAIGRSNYESLQFSKRTGWPGLEQPRI